MPFPELLGYLPSTHDVQSYTVPGASSLTITFSFIRTVWGKDFLSIEDGTGKQIAIASGTKSSHTVQVPGQTVVLRLAAAPDSSADGSPTWGYSITDITGVVSDLTIITESPLPNATVGQMYSLALQVAGGVGPYEFEIRYGTLPYGLSFSKSGLISGRPSAPVTGESIEVRVKDAAGAVAYKSFLITVGFGSPLAISTATLPDGQIYRQYGPHKLVATGGSVPYTWSVSSGSLPMGIKLAPDGTISGLPLVAGEAEFQVRVVDAAGSSATATLQLAILNADDVLITTSSLPSGYVGVVYGALVAASGGTPPYTWSVTAGALPDGLVLDESGSVFGTPTQKGTFTFTVEVVDGAQQVAARGLYIKILDAGDPGDDGGTIGPAGLRIDTTTLASVQYGKFFSRLITASGGTPPYTFAVVSGSLPVGVALSAEGELSGTPYGAGTFVFTVQVTDAAAGTATRIFSLVVAQTEALLGPLNWLTISKHGGGSSNGSNQVFTAHFIVGEATGPDGPQDVFVGENILNPVVVRFPGTPFQCVFAVAEAPEGADLIFDLKRNGSSIFTAPVHLPAGATSAIATNFVPGLKFYFGDVLTLDVLHVGSTKAGKGLIVYVDWR